MIERGLHHRYVKNYIRLSWVICVSESNASVRPVEVIDILSAFKILLFGHILSLILLAGELLVTHYIRKTPPTNISKGQVYM